VLLDCLLLELATFVEDLAVPLVEVVLEALVEVVLEALESLASAEVDSGSSTVEPAFVNGLEDLIEKEYDIYIV